MALLPLLKRDVSKQFIKFALIGLESTILNYLVFLILFYFLSVHYLIAGGSGFIAGVFLGFIFNKLYTFESSQKSSTTLPGYLLVYLFSLIFTIIALKLLVDFVGIDPLISNVFVICITTLINFFGTKILVFKNRKW